MQSVPGLHAHFPQVLIPPLYFSVVTGFACFVKATEFELEYIYIYIYILLQYVAFLISTRNAIQRHTKRQAQNVRVSKDILCVANISKVISAS